MNKLPINEKIIESVVREHSHSLYAEKTNEEGSNSFDIGIFFENRIQSRMTQSEIYLYRTTRNQEKIL